MTESMTEGRSDEKANRVSASGIFLSSALDTVLCHRLSHLSSSLLFLLHPVFRLLAGSFEVGPDEFGIHDEIIRQFAYHGSTPLAQRA